MKKTVVNTLKGLFLPLGMWRTSLVIRTFALYTVFSASMGGAKFLRICRELASGEGWSAALQKVGESYPGDNEVILYGWVGALALLILGPRLGVLIFASGMQTIVFLSRLQAPKSLQAEGHLLIFVPLFIAILAISCSSKQGRLLAASEELERSFNLFFRGVLLASFAFIVIHKTNADFLNRDVSCMHMFWPKGFFGLYPSATTLFHLPRSPWVALTAEAIAPLFLLIMPRVGILILVILLAHLGAQGPQSITWLFIALSFSFLRQSDLAVVLRYRTTAIALVVLAFSLAVLGVLKISGPFEIGQLFRPGLYIGLVLSSFFIVTGLLLTDILRRFRGGGVAPEDTSQSYSRPLRFRTKTILFVAGVLFLANELSPYLGIKHRYSLTMWSNLRADRGRWNSLLVPSWFKVFDYVDKYLVEVTMVRAIPKEKQLVSQPEVADIVELKRIIILARKRRDRLKVNFEYLGKSYFYDNTNPGPSPGVLAILPKTGTVRIAKMSVRARLPDQRSLTTTTLAYNYFVGLLAASEHLDVAIKYRGERFVFHDAHRNRDLAQFVNRLPVAHGLYGAKALSVAAPQKCIHGV